jgi:hypothetical protein
MQIAIGLIQSGRPIRSGARSTAWITERGGGADIDGRVPDTQPKSPSTAYRARAGTGRLPGSAASSAEERDSV